MKVSYNEIINIAAMLGYDRDVHNLISSLDFLIQEGFEIKKIIDGEWDLEFESPRAELLFRIKHSEVL